MHKLLSFFIALAMLLPALVIVMPMPEVAAGTAPRATYSYDYSTYVNNITNFYDGSTGNPTSWQWSWGDGTANSTLQNPTHTFTATGFFYVNLTATNAFGSGTKSRQVFVQEVMTKLIPMSADTGVTSINPTTSYYSAQTLATNYNTEVVTTYALLNWSYSSIDQTKYKILGGYLKVYPASESGWMWEQVRRIDSTWVGTWTWNTKPSIGAAVLATTNLSLTTKYKNISLGTYIYDTATAKTSQNYGIAIMWDGVHKSAAGLYGYFRAVDYTGTANDPYLVVTYGLNDSGTNAVISSDGDITVYPGGSDNTGSIRAGTFTADPYYYLADVDLDCLNPHSNVISIFFNFNMISIGGSDDGKQLGLRVLQTDWSESTVTYATRPTQAGTNLTVINMGYTQPKYFHINITSVFENYYRQTSAFEGFTLIARNLSEYWELDQDDNVIASSINITYTKAPPPTASFTYTRINGNNLAPCPVQFNDTSTCIVTIDTYLWEMDGITYDVADPNHTFDTPGVYTVILTVGSSTGDNFVSHDVYVGLVITFNTDPILSVMATENYIYPVETNVANASFSYTITGGTWAHGYQNWTWGTPQNGSANASVHIRAYNTDGGSWQNFSIEVTAYEPPSGGSGTIIAVTSVPMTMIVVDTAYSYMVVTNPSGCDLDLTTNASWLGLGTTNSTIYGRAPSTPASYSVSIQVDKDTFDTTWQNYTLSVMNYTTYIIGNGTTPEAPYIFMGPPTHLYLGDTYDWTPYSNYNVTGWLLQTNTTFLIINATTGNIYGVANNTGEFYVTVIGSLEPGGNVTMNYTLEVVADATSQAMLDVSMELVIVMAILVLTMALMFWDRKFAFLAGTAWIIAGLFFFYQYDDVYLFLATGIGLILLFIGVEEYVK